ncbi:GTP cyclohydrolase I [Chryseobacterium indoltheticum]|uniref:GTP cyclohydrolase I n=1 Tax=Chryseobacterium indoltheticum TaxID=254 RepID=UPI003F496C3D
MQIVDALKEALGTKDVACIIDAKHLCVNWQRNKRYGKFYNYGRIERNFQNQSYYKTRVSTLCRKPCKTDY